MSTVRPIGSIRDRVPLLLAQVRGPFDPDRDSHHQYAERQIALLSLILEALVYGDEEEKQRRGHDEV